MALHRSLYGMIVVFINISGHHFDRLAFLRGAVMLVYEMKVSIKHAICDSIM